MEPRLEGHAATWTLDPGPPREGGQAWVYAASSGARRGAVKVARYTGAWVARERELLARLGREAGGWVVPLLDYGTTPEGLPFLVLEWFPGTLEDWLGQPRTLEEVLGVLLGAAHALASLHAAGGLREQLLHLDVKPANFLVEPVPAVEPGALPARVVLSDLGLAKRSRVVGVTRVGGAYTPGYAPLEQELSTTRAPDPSIDVHGLAVTVYAALCGRVPDARLASPALRPPGRRLDALGRLAAPNAEEAAELARLAALPAEELFDLAAHDALTAVDESRLRNRLADALSGRCARSDELADAVADLLIPALRGALSPDPRLREKRVSPLYAALAEARDLVGAAVGAGVSPHGAALAGNEPHAEGDSPPASPAQHAATVTAGRRRKARATAVTRAATRHPLLPAGSSPAQAVDAYLERAALRGERSVGQTRLVLLACALASELAVRPLDAWATPSLRVWASVVVILVGVAVSVGLLRALTGRLGATRAAWASVALDAVLVTGVSLPAAIWPPEGYLGQLHLPPFAFFPVAIAAAALRLSRPVLRFGIACNVAGALLLLAVDAASGAPPATTQEWILWAAAFLGASLVADAGSVRARRMVYEGAGSALEAERTRSMLGAYVSPEIAAEALASGVLQPGGRRQAVAILFCDLRGFTAYAARRAPEQLLAELNDYLAAMVGAAQGRGGVVDKFLGDGLMVVFGAPSPMADAASRAVLTAADMLDALSEHNEARTARGLPPFRMGVGIHAGEGVVGNVGTTDRLQYTVIGDVVNVASRLEGATRELGVEVLVSDVVARLAGVLPEDLQLVPKGSVRLRGVEEPYAVWTLG